MKTHLGIFGALVLFLYILFFARLVLYPQVQKTTPPAVQPLALSPKPIVISFKKDSIVIDHATLETLPYLKKYFSNTFVNPCPKPKSKVSDLFLLFVDHTNAIDSAYIPDDLVPLPNQYKKAASDTVCMRVEAAQAFINMVSVAHAKEYMIVASSGFRSSETQEHILQQRVDAIGDKAYSRVALPGHSEHQLGVAADVTSLSIDYVSAANRFGDSQDGKWLAKHAHEYGFIQSYPYGKEYVTGYIYEPWHYRFVGIELAKKLYDTKMTLTEYLQNKGAN